MELKIQDKDVLLALFRERYVNQRAVSKATGYSLGAVNKSLKVLADCGLTDENNDLTAAGKTFIEENSPKRAVIMAAGFGMRMVPINTEYPKALLKIKGEVLIERIIKQLHECGVTDIDIVVGFMKEQFEYLIDGYGVNLIVNREYKEKNNLTSLSRIKKPLSNTYIIPCDVRLEKNLFESTESHSWYMVTDSLRDENNVFVNRKQEMILHGDEKNASMAEIAYLDRKDGEALSKRIKEMAKDDIFAHSFWETALLNEKGKFAIPARVVSAKDIVEINTYEQLRDIDGESENLKTYAIDIISETFGVDGAEIKDITILKKGMTNRSFLFSVGGQKYIMRIPGEGSGVLVDRKEETENYEAIKGKGICDEIFYLNAENGYKITRFIENSRCCDPGDEEDLRICMKRLRDFHGQGLEVGHEFDEFRLLDFYEDLWNGRPSVYPDYKKTKENVLSLRPYIEKYTERSVLSHIDPNQDNFLIYEDESGEKQVKLIDWEYAGMHDPDIDVAMFCIYAMYDRDGIDRLIDIYFEGGCRPEIRVKIYCYIAVCGLLWSNWCEYKEALGVEFGEYSLKQYRYAKEFYRIATSETEKF